MQEAIVMIIDNQPEVRDLLLYSLKGAGMKVQYFRSSKEALYSLQRPDLILCEWNLPDIAGLELCRIVKQGTYFANIPFVMFTFKSDEQDRLKALEVGADDHIAKPISMTELVYRIRQIIYRSKRRQQSYTPLAPIQYHGIELDIQGYSFRIEGIDINLTYSEFKLASMMMQEVGRIFSRIEILRRLRGEGYIPDERSVDVIVAGLRKKMGTYRTLLESVRGVGYRFKTDRL